MNSQKLKNSHDDEEVNKDQQAKKQQQPGKISLLSQFFSPHHPPLNAHASLINHNLLFAVRILSFLFLTVCYVLIFLKNSNSLLDHFIYLTFYGYFLTWLFYVSVVQSKIFANNSLQKYTQILFQTALCFEVTITIMYWGVLHQSSKNWDFFFDFSEHACPLFLLLIDFVLNAYRFIPSQSIILLIFIWIYLLICSLPYALLVEPVYGDNLDWRSAKSYILIVISNVISLLIFLIGRIIFQKCKKNRLTSGQKSSNQEGTAQVISSTLKKS